MNDDTNQPPAAEAEPCALPSALPAAPQQADADSDSEAPTYAFGPYKRAASGHEDGLVVLAMRLPYKLVKREEGYFMLVADEHKETVARQLYLARQERWRWKKLRAAVNAPLPPEAPASPFTLVAFALILAGFFLWQHYGNLPTAKGLMNSKLVLQDGQWWRLFTALTLHSNAGHLLANIVSGVGLGLLANRTFGAGFTWLFTILGGGLGNLLTSWFYHGTMHVNYGASTAVFATLGLIIGHALLVTLNTHGRKQWRHYQAPLVVGIVVLALTGTGGQNTDVVAHVGGFIAGIPLGIFAGWLRLKKSLDAPESYTVLYTLTLLLVVLPWLAATGWLHL